MGCLCNSEEERTMNESEVRRHVAAVMNGDRGGRGLRTHVKLLTDESARKGKTAGPEHCYVVGLHSYGLREDGDLGMNYFVLRAPILAAAKEKQPLQFLSFSRGKPKKLHREALQAVERLRTKWIRQICDEVWGVDPFRVYPPATIAKA